MDVWIRMVFVIVTTIFGTSGFWAYIQSKSTRTNSTTRLLMGVAYQQITTLGLEYIERGSITKDELEDFRLYFFEPYSALGGNGVAKRIMRDVENLPFRPHNQLPRIFRNEPERLTSNVQYIDRARQEATPQ